MEVKIVEVSSRKQLMQFIKFPKKLYAGNPCFVPALDSGEFRMLGKANPAHEFCGTKYLLAMDGLQVVGRIAAIANSQEIEQKGIRKLRFGWLDFEDNHAVSAALIGAVEHWGRELRLNHAEGPVGFSNMDRVGMLTSGFDELSNMATIYNAAYYPEHLSQLGYREDKQWLEHEIESPAEVPAKLHQLQDIIQRRYDVRILPIKHRSDILPYIKPFMHLMREAYQDLPSYVPLTPRQMEFYASQFKRYLNPEYLCFVGNRAGDLLGFGISIPSVAKALQRCNGKIWPFGWWHLLREMRRPDRAELLLIGIHPDWQNKGLTSLIFPKIMETVIRHGVKKVESNPELVDNKAVQALWKQYTVRQHKTRATFVKNI
jgi:GNAT superfamily N-acetyltransferase